MCTVSSPKPQPVDTSKTTPVYMHNAYLDGLGINSANTGRNALRIDPGTAAASPNSPTQQFPIFPMGGGGGGGGEGRACGGGGSGMGQQSMGLTNPYTNGTLKIANPYS